MTAVGASLPALFARSAAAADEPAMSSAAVAESWRPTIAAADRLCNAVQTRYDGPDRSSFVVSNEQLRLVHGLVPGTGGGTLVQSLQRADGSTYVSSTMDVVAVDAAGRTFRSALSVSPVRMNQWRLGVYYTEVDLLDIGLRREGATDADILVFGGFDFANSTEGWVATQYQTPAVVQDGAIVGTILDPTNPGLSVTGASVDVGTGTKVRIRLRYAGSAATVLFFWGTADHPGFVARERSVRFSLVNDGQYHDYVVDLAGPEFGGPLTDLRMDFLGADVGATYALDSVYVIDDSAVNLPVRVARVLHTYGDRLYEEVTWYPTRPVTLRDAFVELAGAASAIGSVGAGGSDWADAVGPNGVDSRPAGTGTRGGLGWAGFGVNGVGTLGWVLPSTAGNGTVSVQLADGRWALRHHAALPAGGTVTPSMTVHVGHRLITSVRPDFRELQLASDIESHPLGADQVKVLNADANTGLDGYEPYSGQYRFHVPGIKFPDAFAAPQTQPEAVIVVANDGRARSICCRVENGAHGPLEAGVVLDRNRRLLPVQVEVCKNFMGENEEPFYDTGDTGYGEAYFPVVLAPQQTQQFSAVHLYQNWGTFPIKEISSIRFFEPYYHLSTGVTETDTYVPFFVSGRTGWMLPDFRARSGVQWPGKPEYDSVGQNFFLSYTDAAGTAVGIETTGARIDSVGPCYSDATFTFRTDDGKARVSERFVEMPMTDQNRVFCTLRIEFDDAVHIDDPGNNLALFRTRSRSQTFTRFGYLDAGNQPQVLDALAASSAGTFPLGNQAPYWALFDAAPTHLPGGGVNIGLLVQRSLITVGGVAKDDVLAVTNSATSIDPSSAVNTAMLTLNLPSVTFQAGDVIELDLVLMPFGGPNLATDQMMRDLRQQWGLNRLQLSAARGTVSPDRMVPTVAVVDQGVEGPGSQFTVTGGFGNTTILITGLTQFDRPRIEIANGSNRWQTLDTSVKGYDGYQVAPDGDHFAVSFVDTLDGSPRTYRVNRG